MAITPRDHEAFIREVDEGLREDQLRSYWQRYGKATVFLVVLLLAALGFYFWWQGRQQEEAGRQGAELTAALELTGDRAAATAKLDPLTKSDNSGYRASALLAKANIAIDKGDFAGAAALFRQIAADKKLAAPYHDLATIRLTALEFDGLPPQQVIDRLRPYAAAGNSWFGSAGEMTAMAYLKQNKPRDAARIFAAMAKDQKVTDTIRNRAAQMAGSLGGEVVADAAPQRER